MSASKFSLDHIAIIGGGIAGLSTALSLAARGISSSVFERNDGPTEVGAGIQITPNGSRVLEQIGVLKAVEETASKPKSLHIHDGNTGSSITRMPLNIEDNAAPYMSVHRGDLLVVLHNAAKASPEIKLNYSSEIEADQIDAPIIVGADGVWSQTRQIHIGTKASPSGKTAFRALIPVERAPEEFRSSQSIGLFLNADTHLVKYAVSSDSKFNLVAVFNEADTPQSWSTLANAEDVLKAFNHWPSSIKRLLAEADIWKKWPLFTVQPNARWQKGNIVLVGDAAHGMAPFVAQGGCMALEDAAVFADSVRQYGATNNAILTYVNQRQPRVTKVWQEAMANAKRYHWSGPMAMARNLGLKTIGGEGLSKRYSWIYSWHPPDF